MCSNSPMGSAHEISHLPIEILPTIFKFLSAKERKSVKLVCRSWFEMCNRLSFTNFEVLNCLGIYQLPDIFEFLKKSERRFLNLKFDFVEFNEDLSFWENDGSRIRSLAFKNCQFGAGFEDILFRCQNLFHLSFTYTTDFAHKFASKSHLPFYSYIHVKPQPFDNLETVFKQGMVYEKLHSLKMDVRLQALVNLSDQLMNQLFSVFPNLKILEIINHNYGALAETRSYWEDDDEGAVVNFTLASVLNYLAASTDRIEKLKLHFPFAKFSSDELRSIFETLSAMKRLTDLSINLGSNLKQNDVENFLHFKPLKSFELSRWISEEPVSLESLLSSSTLEHLKVEAPIDSSISIKPLFEKLMSSGLKSCKIIMKNSILMSDPNPFDSQFLVEKRPTSLPNLSVRIHRSGPRNTEGEMVQFLQYFQNLRHLLIDDISYNELQSLLQCQKKLKSLVLRAEGQLNNLSETHIDVFTNAFSQLTGLEYLELSKSVSYIFLRSLSPGSILMNLKYLKISLLVYADNMIFPSELLKLADATPFLEGLYVQDSGNIPFSLCVMLCTKLSRLRFLRWDRYPVNDPLCSDELFRKLFPMCPSLRLLYYTSIFEYIYFFDTINKEVVCVLQNDDANKPYTFAKPRIDGYTVDWLTFPKKNSYGNKHLF